MKPRLSGHANRKKAEEKRVNMHEAQALQHNILHAQFFGMPNIPVREIRERLDPILRAQHVREILKIDLTNDGDGDDTTYN
jgi:bacterioferritin (cytochrome b1)